MIVSADADRCAGHGACVATCPELFTLTSDGYVEVTADRVPDELVELVKRAAAECPEKAILVDTP
ncbi:ferredoxin [Frankia sp. Mgl5]|uniref:ferredoxin n=1 Tax=Frankia sp. Mgl5 TaxID=2933793 RepID=UPI0020102E11|nr:ferredoxin [Frankia sp. Mgl5]MCK9929645.1 ferredoxin [Frankia sp. Mgl5]